jgi:SAM-dependent methyltransferase
MSHKEPDGEGRRHDNWTCLDAPGAAAAAIAKLETLGRSAAEAEARNRYLDLLDLQQGHSALDVGAGTGLVAIEMARRVGRTGRVVALDPSAPIGAYGHEAAARSGVGDIPEWRSAGRRSCRCRAAGSTAASAVGSCCMSMPWKLSSAKCGG